MDMREEVIFPRAYFCIPVHVVVEVYMHMHMYMYMCMHVHASRACAPLYVIDHAPPTLAVSE